MGLDKHRKSQSGFPKGILEQAGWRAWLRLHTWWCEQLGHSAREKPRANERSRTDHDRWRIQRDVWRLRFRSRRNTWRLNRRALSRRQHQRPLQSKRWRIHWTVPKSVHQSRCFAIQNRFLDIWRCGNSQSLERVDSGRGKAKNLLRRHH